MHFVSGTVHFVSGTVKTPQYPAYENLYSLYYRDLFVHQQKRATLACDHPATRTRTAARIAMPSTLPSTSAIRIGVGQLNSPSSLPRGISHSDAPLEPPRLRTTRGAKRRRRHQGRQTPFVGDDYEVADGMPHLDEHGIRDVESSQQTKKLVIGRGSLRLRSVSPQEDDDNMSTEESDVDPRCMEPNDPTVRIRT